MIKSHEEDEAMQTGATSPTLAPANIGLRHSASAVNREANIQSLAPDKMRVERLNFYYGRTRVLKDITLSIVPSQVTAFIGPSGCGKSTLIRTLNRMNDVIPGTRVEGLVELDGQDI